MFSQKIDQKRSKRLNRRGIVAESPADAEILTLIQKYLHHFKAYELTIIGHLKIFVNDDKEKHETKLKVKEKSQVQEI